MQHDDDPVADGADHREIVADEGERQSQIAAQLGQQGQDLRLGRHVQSGDDLVRDDEGRLQGDGAGDADPLALAATDFMGIAADQPGREPDPLE